MSKPKILYVSQEIIPFLPESEISTKSRFLPQRANENDKEIRVFMPRFGCINERRHQLHEVIRLSGMNLIINDHDHPLIIKVASIQEARMQVYFIDNEEYFKRKFTTHDAEGNFFEDNDERSIFFCKGVLETVKKLGWKPDIIHCHGWQTALLPLYMKKLYFNDPHFLNTQVVYSAYDKDLNETLNNTMGEKLAFDGFDAQDLEGLKSGKMIDLHKIGVNFADAVVKGSEELDSELTAVVDNCDKPILEHASEEDFDVYNEFYDSVLQEEAELA